MSYYFGQEVIDMKAFVSPTTEKYFVRKLKYKSIPIVVHGANLRVLTPLYPDNSPEARQGGVQWRYPVPC